MLDIKFIETHKDFVKENLEKRYYNVELVDQSIELNHSRKSLVTEIESHKANNKKLSKEIGKIKKEGGDAQSIMDQVHLGKQKIEGIEEKLEKVEHELHEILINLPNILAEDVPLGKDEDSNVELERIGTPRTFSFPVQDHITLGENLGQFDFEKAAQISGSRFVIYKKDLARLERALINYMLDSHNKNGYDEVFPPAIVHERSLYGSGQLPKFKDDLFKIEESPFYLISTGEVPLVNLKREEIFSKSEFPIKVCAFTPCFRKEAGTYGKDTRGIIRLHQFNKVELVNIVDPEESEKAHEDMIGRACQILEELELPYKKMLLCSGDTSFTSSKTIDLEIWIPSQNKYREISSISNCLDFQARRADIRFRNSEGRPEYAHTLNGSGLAVGRTVVAIMENYQNEDGSITIPKVLRPYMGGQEIIK